MHGRGRFRTCDLSRVKRSTGLSTTGRNPLSALGFRPVRRVAHIRDDSGGFGGVLASRWPLSARTLGRQPDTPVMDEESTTPDRLALVLDEPSLLRVI